MTRHSGRTAAAGGPPPVSVFAGVSAAALALAGLLLPAAQRGTVTPAAPPCTQAAPGSATGYTLCLSVTQVTKASKLLPGHDADFTLQVWLAGQPPSPSPSTSPSDTASPSGSATPSPAATTPTPSPSPSPTADGVTVTLSAATGGPVPSFLSCPATVSNGACPLGTLTPGPPASTLTADVAIPATATAGQTVSFTITTATGTAGVGTPAATQSFTVAAPPVPSSPAATSPAATPAAAGTTPTPVVGATLPAGLGTPTAMTSVPALGPLPGPATTGPAATFPVVTPGPSLAPAASSGRVPLANVSEQFALMGNQLGVRFGGLALAAALACLGTALVTIRRRPRPGSEPARTQPRGGYRRP